MRQARQTNKDKPGIFAMRNSHAGYGLVAMLLHWLVALVVIGMFSLGLWMVDLTYYDAWYNEAPAIHKGIGILLFLVMSGRVLWRLGNPRPVDEPHVSLLERRLAHGAHMLLYLLIFVVIISGYLISTADARPIEVFGLFSVPALVSHLPEQADIAGVIHLYLAITLVSLAGLHALAALKHHFLDHDRTLLKMLKPVRKHQA
jgi:cytochrome b561